MQRSPRMSSGHAAGSWLLHAARSFFKINRKWYGKKKCWGQMTDEGCRGGKENLDKGWSGSRMTRVTFTDSRFKLSIDPRGWGLTFRTVVVAQRFERRSISNGESIERCETKENLSLVDTRTVVEALYRTLYRASTKQSGSFPFFFFFFFFCSSNVLLCLFRRCSSRLGDFFFEWTIIPAGYNFNTISRQWLGWLFRLEFYKKNWFWCWKVYRK